MDIQPTKKPIRIAIADDGGMLRDFLVRDLKAQPDFHLLFDAVDGLEYQEKMCAETRKPDVVILDVHMPGMNGYDCARWTKGRYPNIHVLALTNLTDPRVAVGMVRNGARAVMEKDRADDELVTAIRALVRDGHFLNEHLSPALLRKAEAGEIPVGIERLGKRAFLFLRLVCAGLKPREIAERMNISQHSVKDYFKRMYAQFEVTDRAELAMVCQALGICMPEEKT